MIRRASLSLAALLGAACRFGGPEGSATELIAVDGGPSVAESDGEDLPDEGDDLGADSPAPDAREAVPDAVPSDAAAPIEADSLALACSPSAGLACDVVSGLGCLPLMQCVIDSSSSTPAAHCVFSGIMLDATCSEDALSTNCPLQHTCMMGACRKYCCSHADCELGSRCNAASGANADVFKVCEPTLP